MNPLSICNWFQSRSNAFLQALRCIARLAQGREHGCSRCVSRQLCSWQSPNDFRKGDSSPAVVTLKQCLNTMTDSRSIPGLVTLLSQSLLFGASCDADEKRRRSRSFSRLAFTTLLGLNQQVNIRRRSSAHFAHCVTSPVMYQAVMTDVDEDLREQVNDLKVQQVSQPVTDHTKILCSSLQAQSTTMCAGSTCSERERASKSGRRFPAVSLKMLYTNRAVVTACL